MLTNDIKKGMRVQLSNGWFGTMMDNMRGNTRMVEVEGIFTEIGSVYAHDIVAVIVNRSNLDTPEVIKVTHTAKQNDMREMLSFMDNL